MAMYLTRMTERQFRVVLSDVRLSVLQLHHAPQATARRIRLLTQREKRFPFANQRQHGLRERDSLFRKSFPSRPVLLPRLERSARRLHLAEPARLAHPSQD